MDWRGDVWVDDLDSWLLRKLSAVDGSVVATIMPLRRATYIVAGRDGSLVMASNNLLTGAQAGVFIDRYKPDGTYLDGVDLKSLFPPGVFAPLQYVAATVPGRFLDILRVLVTRSGAIWVFVQNSACNPVLRLTPNLQLEGSYGLYAPQAMVPDESEGIWVLHRSGPVVQTFPVNSPNMPGLPYQGWVHLSAQGQVLDSNPDAMAIGDGITQSHGHRRYDGRQFQHPAPGATTTPMHIRVSNPGNAPFPWFPWADRIDFAAISQPFANVSGFHLDGAQRLWVHRSGNLAAPQPNWQLQQWVRFPVEPHYQSPMISAIGECVRLNPTDPSSYSWSSFWGNATLFEYAHYTDPYGDLDGDGVPNNVELANFANPLLANGFSSAVTATSSGGAPGTPLTVLYSIPDDKGLPYAAPFCLSSPSTLALGGGHFLPIPITDPLVLHCLTPGASGVTGTIGVISPQGTATATINIPPIPTLSGMKFTSCIATRAPNLPGPFKTVSRAFTFRIP
jgi:hypothetical protein